MRNLPDSTRGSGPDVVHRVGAAALGAGLCLFGVLGFVTQVGFLTTRGEKVLGLSSNGLLATISLVVGAALIAAASRGGRIASTVSTTIGVLFLLSGLLNLAVLNTEVNLLAFRMPNVVFSVVAGIMLLTLGAYGRFSGGLPADNPYYRQRHPDGVGAGRLTVGREAGSDEADRVLLVAEAALALGRATPEQERLVREEAQRRADEARRRAWESYEGRQLLARGMEARRTA